MNLDPEINEAIEKAIAKHERPGDHIDYRSGLTVVAGDGGQPQVIAVIVLRMNAGVIGEHITTAFFTDTPLPTFEQIDEPMAERLMALRMARVEQMQPNQAKELIDPMSGNGHRRRLEIPHA